MFLDDLIRYHFHLIFNFNEFTSITSHMIKVTRDAELDMEGDVSKSYINKIVESVRERILAEPVRLVYDTDIPEDMLNLVKDLLGMDSTDSLIPGGRYHHRRDYMNFPQLKNSNLQYDKVDPVTIPGLSLEKSIIKKYRNCFGLDITQMHRQIRFAVPDNKTEDIRKWYFETIKKSKIKTKTTPYQLKAPGYLLEP